MRLKLIALVSTLVLMLGVLSLPVKADSGIAFGVIGNMATFDTDGVEVEGSGAEKNAATHSSDVDYPEIFLHYAGCSSAAPTGSCPNHRNLYQCRCNRQEWSYTGPGEHGL